MAQSGTIPPNKELTIIYLVRHAEKDMTQSTDDPELSPEGKRRAEQLQYLLKDVGISRVYSTDTKRTRATAAPLAAGIGKAVEIYGRDSQAFAQSLIGMAGERILVVGHSNTVPDMLNVFAGAGTYKQEEAYGNLFQVILHKGKAIEIQKLHF